MTKQELRAQIKKTIAQIKPAERDTASLYVCLQIIGTEEWQNAQTVMLYRALADEIDLSLLIQDAEGSDKRVIMPEASADAPALPDDELWKVELAIIPGRAFTKRGDRMGRGKGYYDRLLSKLNCPKWGVAFPCQIVRELPTDEWDVRVEKVIY